MVHSGRRGNGEEGGDGGEWEGVARGRVSMTEGGMSVI